MYSFFRKVLFCLDAEDAHNMALKGLSVANSLGLSCILSGRNSVKADPVTVAGVTFANRVGLAAGMDKNGDYIEEFGSLGFGFLEVGTVTPRPQSGNPRPRMFRLPEAEAIINRMGFNNKGVDHLVQNLKKRRYEGVVGVNIGKNFDTPLEDAHKDYVTCLNAVYDHCDYVTVNISSPNTQGLRDLQGDEHLKRLLGEVATARKELADRSGMVRPLFLKIAPDLSDEAVVSVVGVVESFDMDGIIATNTTISRDLVGGLKHGGEAGGLSGAPLRKRALEVVALIAKATEGRLPIIGVGGISTADDAVTMSHAGASLIQLYTGLVYRGPELIPSLIAALDNR